MSHFAELNDNNVVLRVVVVNNEVLTDKNGNESEQKGIDFLKSLYGENTNWVQTSYNSSFRKNYAGIGYKYDDIADAFISPKPFESWILNEQTYKWESPIPRPDDGKVYTWDEQTISWLEMPTPTPPE